MNLCDSDKYALLLILQRYLPAIVHQLKEQDIDIDSLEYVDMNFQKMVMLSNGNQRLQRLAHELSPAEQYVQQLYRFLSLSRLTYLRPSEDVTALRKTMIDKMVVVGTERRKVLEGL